MKKKMKPYHKNCECNLISSWKWKNKERTQGVKKEAFHDS